MILTELVKCANAFYPSNKDKLNTAAAKTRKKPLFIGKRNEGIA